MASCMRCGAGINEKNYVFTWTLMCKRCDKEYKKEQKKLIKKEKKEKKK